MQRNMTVAVILIVLFIILIIIGFMIWAHQHQVSFFARRKAVDEESTEGG
jgi:cytochrome c-type biogenesis protein CcmE